MKNYIPIILAVLLGIAAVVAVSRILKEREAQQQATTAVVSANRDIAAGAAIDDTMIQKKAVPIDARPSESIPWSKRALILGQTTRRAVSTGDYILTSDISFAESMAALVGSGEWAVTLQASGGVASLVQPGDEVAVIGSFTVVQQVQPEDLSKPPVTQERQLTAVLFPKVRVLAAGGGADAGPAGIGAGGRNIIVALPPKQAQILIAAQRRADLELALRKPEDAAAVDRVELGKVDDDTFIQLTRGLPTVELPKVPGMVNAAETD